MRRALSIPQAVAALEEALGAQGFPDIPVRSQVETSHGTLLTMPSAGEAGSGVKLVTVAPGNPARGLPLVHGLFVIFSADAMRPVAVIDGGALTELRTCAVSAVATRQLARPDAAHLVLFGAGAQAHAHLEAMCAVRAIRTVAVVDVDDERAEALAARARELGMDASVAGPEAVADADVICTCTTSELPLFDGGLLRPGTHVNAMGAFQPHARELDDATIARAGIVVETRATALAEAGDVIIPLRSGVIGAASALAELPDVIRARGLAASGADVTVFKSLGHAFEDLVVADALLRAYDAGTV